MVGDISVHQISNVLCLNCASVVCSRNSLGSVFQSLAAENFYEVCPHSVLTNGKSNKVKSLRDRQCLCDRFTIIRAI